MQCDQIGRILKAQGNKYSFKSRLKYLVTYGTILKNINFKSKNLGNFLFQHLVTLIGR